MAMNALEYSNCDNVVGEVVSRTWSCSCSRVESSRVVTTV